MAEPRDAAGNHLSTYDAQEEQDDSDTIYVQQPLPKKPAHIRTTSQVSTAASNSTATSTGFERGLSLTSPSVSASAHRALIAPKRKRTPPTPERIPSSALKQPAKKAQNKGSAENPIVLEEYSPRRQSRTLPKPRGLEEGPHKFYKASRRKYSNNLIRPPLAPKPTNGSTFTGDIGRDIHRMRSAKFAAGGYGPQASPSVIGFGVPFEVQYPILAQHVAQQSTRRTTIQQKASEVQDKAKHQVQPRPTPSNIVPRPKPFTFMPPLTPSNSVTRRTPSSSISMPPPAPSKDALRRKALQHIRDHSRPQLLKKPLPADPDETSASEPESEAPSLLSSASSKRGKMTVYQDPNDHLTPLIAQSKVLTSLLQKYPDLRDKKGVREDVAMLVSVQNERLGMWMKDEGKGRKRGESKSKSKSKSDGRSREKVAKGQESKVDGDGDGEVRGLLRANAKLWQDGSGEGVADVYQVEEGEGSA